MKTEAAIAHAGSPKALSELLQITPSAISQWGDEVPKAREWQLRVLRPHWFEVCADDEAHPESKAA
jgi:transcriptional repressor of cell division inhibition gene dicB